MHEPVTLWYVMLEKALIASAVGGLIWLDRYQVFQFMISRPIVGATVVGAILGDLSAGIASGVLFELLWLRRPPVGGFIAPDVTLASVATAAVSACVRSATDLGLTAVVFVCFLFLLPVCFAGRKMDERLRLGLGKISRSAAKLQTDGRDAVVWLHIGAGLALGFSLAFLLLAPVIYIGAVVLSRLAPLIPPILDRALSFGYFSVPLVGIADLLLGLEDKETIVLFALGFLVALGGALIIHS
ncbi:MAG: PTS sugar transporter subunit IIC [Thermodesulfobacteriota bacterium]